MIAKRMQMLVAGSSTIRAMFEEGLKLAEKYGAENVFDFSLGNPNVPAPEAIKKAAISILETEDPIKLHGYMPNGGYPDVREKIAQSLNKRFGTAFSCSNIYMTVGAAGGLNVILKVLMNPGEEVVTFAPYFAEYKNYVSNVDSSLVVVPPNPPTFLPDFKAFEDCLSPKTKAVIVNSPNNPTGVIYSEETIKAIAAILKAKEAEYGHPIYIISDEPYRELVYGNETVPYITKYYSNTIVGYSYSKSLSLPGERIGYLVVPSEADDFESISNAIPVAIRILGFVNAPSLQQRVVAECLDASTDISYYERNRNTLFEGLTKLGFECVKPQGAFYLFIKNPLETNTDFVFGNICKNHNILLVPGVAFGCQGYSRIAYCVSYEKIVNSLPRFAEIARECGL